MDCHPERPGLRHCPDWQLTGSRSDAAVQAVSYAGRSRPRGADGRTNADTLISDTILDGRVLGSETGEVDRWR
jgi:hypothetical protein